MPTRSSTSTSTSNLQNTPNANRQSRDVTPSSSTWSVAPPPIRFPKSTTSSLPRSEDHDRDRSNSQSSAKSKGKSVDRAGTDVKDRGSSNQQQQQHSDRLKAEDGNGLAFHLGNTSAEALHDKEPFKIGKNSRTSDRDKSKKSKGALTSPNLQSTTTASPNHLDPNQAQFSNQSTSSGRSPRARHVSSPVNSSHPQSRNLNHPTTPPGSGFTRRSRVLSNPSSSTSQNPKVDSDDRKRGDGEMLRPNSKVLTSFPFEPPKDSPASRVRNISGTSYDSKTSGNRNDVGNGNGNGNGFMRLFGFGNGNGRNKNYGSTLEVENPISSNSQSQSHSHGSQPLETSLDPPGNSYQSLHDNLNELEESRRNLNHSTSTNGNGRIENPILRNLRSLIYYPASLILGKEDEEEEVERLERDTEEAGEILEREALLFQKRQKEAHQAETNLKSSTSTSSQGQHEIENKRKHKSENGTPHTLSIFKTSSNKHLVTSRPSSFHSTSDQNNVRNSFAHSTNSSSSNEPDPLDPYGYRALAGPTLLPSHATYLEERRRERSRARSYRNAIRLIIALIFFIGLGIFFVALIKFGLDYRDGNWFLMLER